GATDLPSAKADRRYLQVGLAELSILHAFPRHCQLSGPRAPFAAPLGLRDYLGMPAAPTRLSRGLLASGAAACGNPNGSLGNGWFLSRWDQRFESALLQRRVCELEVPEEPWRRRCCNC